MCAPDVAFERLYQAHAGELHGFARRRVGRQDAEDVVQEAYLHLLQTGMAATLEHPRAYLFRIAANLTVDAARKLETRARYTDDEAVFLGFAASRASPESEAVRTLEMRRFHASLAELPNQCREAFLLNQIEGRTRAEIAKRLGLSVRTIDRHILRAFAHVRRRLQADEHLAANRTPVRIAGDVSQQRHHNEKMRQGKHVEPIADLTGSDSTLEAPALRKAAA